MRSRILLIKIILKGGGLMPEFGNPFSGVAHDRRLTPEELVRAIRFSIAAEYEAIQFYMQLAESIDHDLASRVLREIADEERVHAGEFLRLLKELEPEEEKFYAEGAGEVEEQMEKINTEREGKKDKKEESRKSEPDAPFCTTAPSAEHARASNVDEPCYDATQGNLKKE
jgi:rubrerythrin